MKSKRVQVLDILLAHRPDLFQKSRMRWTDIYDIAIALEEVHPDKDNINLRYTDFRDWIVALPEFTDKPDGCNEKILEAIQQAWIDERS